MVTAWVDTDEAYWQICRSTQTGILDSVNNQYVIGRGYVQVGAPVMGMPLHWEFENFPEFTAEGLFFGFDTADRAATSLDNIKATIYYTEKKVGY